MVLKKVKYKKMLQDIQVSFGGRIAEELIFGDITTGASQDIKQATQTAQAMVVKYGMSDKVGMINLDDNQEEVFIGRDLAHQKGYSEKTAAIVDEEVKSIVDSCYDRAEKILRENEEILHSCANLLIEKEKITKELRKIISK